MVQGGRAAGFQLGLGAVSIRGQSPLYSRPGAKGCGPIGQCFAGDDERISLRTEFVLPEHSELAGAVDVLLQQNSAVSFGAPFGRMVASGEVAAKCLSLPAFLGVSAVHASPLKEKGLQGTTVHLQPVNELCSGKASLPARGGYARHGLGIGNHSGNALQTEATWEGPGLTGSSDRSGGDSRAHMDAIGGLSSERQ